MAITPTQTGAAYIQNADKPKDSPINPDSGKKPSASIEIAGIEQEVSKETLRIQSQASLINHLFGDEKTKDSNALKILYQETIEKLNEVLAPDLGPNAISAEKLAEQGGMEYWSPENTANRIVQGTTGFFEAYKEANPQLSGEALLDKFLDVIGGGIEKGFNDAKDILSGFEVYDGTVKNNAEATYDLVQKGLAAFREQQMEKMGLNAKDSETEDNKPSESGAANIEPKA